VSRFRERGNDSAVIKVLNETSTLYSKQNGEPLETFREIRNYALKKTESSDFHLDVSETWMMVARWYRTVIKNIK